MNFLICSEHSHCIEKILIAAETGCRGHSMRIAGGDQGRNRRHSAGCRRTVSRPRASRATRLRFRPLSPIRRSWIHAPAAGRQHQGSGRRATGSILPPTRLRRSTRRRNKTAHKARRGEAGNGICAAWRRWVPFLCEIGNYQCCSLGTGVSRASGTAF